VRRIALFITSTIAGLILLFSYRTSLGPSSGQTVATTQGGNGVGIVSGGSDPGTGAATDPGATASTGAGPTPSASPSATGATETVNGSVAQTRWGPVQVQVVITKGRITDVRAIVYPNNNREDEAINSYALPQLHDQVLSAQSANIDGVSGATVTSGGYIESLQAALDYAHFG
jgi:uncharacterized protein with FMN-binding domain